MDDLYQVDFNTASDGMMLIRAPRHAVGETVRLHDPDDGTELPGRLVLLDPAHDLGYVAIEYARRQLKKT